MGHFCRLSEKGPKEIEEIVEGIKEGEREERETGMKMKKKQKKTEEIKTSPSTLTCYKDNRPGPTVSQSQLDVPVTSDTRHFSQDFLAPISFFIHFQIFNLNILKLSFME